MRANCARDRRRFDQSKDDSAEAERGQQAARPVELLAWAAGPAFRDFPQSQHQDDQPQRKIDEKHPSPRTVLGEPSAQHRTDRGGDRRESGPRPDSATALLLGKISADQSQAAGDKQRPAYSLKAPGDNKLPDVGRQSAPGRGSGEEHNAGGEDLAAAVQVAQRPADEKQRRQEKRVRFHNPLNVRDGRMQGRLQRRQRHVHDRAVNERHARTEDGRGQNPGAVRGSRPARTNRRESRLRRKEVWRCWP